VSLTWQLVCRAAGGCPGGSSGNSDHGNQQAFLNVYASAVYISDPAGPPAPTLTGDFGDGLPHKGALTGTVEAGDAAGVRSIEATFAGKTQTTALVRDPVRLRRASRSAAIPPACRRAPSRSRSP
jgi:hypothetical protein